MGSDRTKYTDTLADTDVTYYNFLRNGDKVYSSETDVGLNVSHLFDNDSNVSGDIWSTAWYDNDGSNSVAIYEFSQGPKNITKMSFKQSPLIQTAYTGAVSIYYHNGTSFVAVTNPSVPTIQNAASSPFVITFDSVVSDKFKIVAQPASGATHAALQEWSLYASQQDFNIEELNSATISYDATAGLSGNVCLSQSVADGVLQFSSNASNIINNSADWSVAGWFKDTQIKALSMEGLNTGNNMTLPMYVGFVNDTGNYSVKNPFSSTSTTDTTIGTSVPVNQWNHLAVTHKFNPVTMTNSVAYYINSVLRSEFTMNIQTNVTQSSMSMVKLLEGSGLIDELRIYDATLPASHMYAIYNDISNDSDNELLGVNTHVDNLHAICVTDVITSGEDVLAFMKNNVGSVFSFNYSKDGNLVDSIVSNTVLNNSSSTVTSVPATAVNSAYVYVLASNALLAEITTNYSYTSYQIQPTNFMQYQPVYLNTTSAMLTTNNLTSNVQLGDALTNGFTFATRFQLNSSASTAEDVFPMVIHEDSGATGNYVYGLKLNANALFASRTNEDSLKTFVPTPDEWITCVVCVNKDAHMKVLINGVDYSNSLSSGGGMYACPIKVKAIDIGSTVSKMDYLVGYNKAMSYEEMQAIFAEHNEHIEGFNAKHSDDVAFAYTFTNSVLSDDLSVLPDFVVNSGDVAYEIPETSLYLYAYSENPHVNITTTTDTTTIDNAYIYSSLADVTQHMAFAFVTNTPDGSANVDDASITYDSIVQFAKDIESNATLSDESINFVIETTPEGAIKTLSNVSLTKVFNHLTYDPTSYPAVAKPGAEDLNEYKTCLVVKDTLGNYGVATFPPMKPPESSESFTQYKSRDLSYTTLENVIGPTGNNTHPVAPSGLTSAEAGEISTNGNYIVKITSAVKPGAFVVYKNTASSGSDPIFEEYALVYIPSDAGLENVTTTNQSSIRGSFISHDGTYVFAYGSNWAYVYKRNDDTNTYDVYDSFASRYSQITSHGTTNFNYSSEARMSANADTIVMIETGSTTRKTGAIWVHNKIEERYDLIHTDGFDPVYLPFVYKAGRSCAVSGDGKTIAVYSGVFDWGNGTRINLGYRVYKYNKDTNSFEQSQNTRYSNYASGVEPEENTSHDFLAQTGGGSTIGQSTPASSWLQGTSFEDGIVISYDGNWLMLHGTNDYASYKDGLCALFKLNPDDGKYHYWTSFIQSVPAYGLSYTTWRTSGGNNQPTKWATDVAMSADATYISVLSNNYENICVIFKRDESTGEYSKVFEYKSGAWAGAGGIFNGVGQFFSIRFTGDGGFFAVNNYRIYTPVS